jgi:putative hemolysin
MPAAAWKLLALFALVLMPFGMAAAPAAAHGAAHGTVASAMAHCGEQGSKSGKAAHQASDCTATCAMTMAEPARLAEPTPMLRSVLAPSHHHYIDGLHPEAAIPPPRTA